LIHFGQNGLSNPAQQEMKINSSMYTRDGSGKNFFDPGWVSHLWVWKISPKNPKKIPL